MTLVRGERVRIRAAGTSHPWVDAEVAVVASSGTAAGLMLDGVLRTIDNAVFAGAMPLLIDPATERFTGMDQREYEVERARAQGGGLN